MIENPEDFAQMLDRGGLADFFAACALSHRKEYLE